jgi:outer membrane receptor protein involved in Fe transport
VAARRARRAEPAGQHDPGFGDTRSSHRQIGTFNYTHIFGRRSSTRPRRLQPHQHHLRAQRGAEPADYGINNGITEALVLPQITVQGVGLNFGGPAGFPQGRTDTTYVLADTLSWAKGRHSLKFGGEYRRFHNINFGNNGGTFTYPSLADFQAGRGTAFTVTLGDLDSDITQQALGLFVQDNVRLNANLSVELGLRYDRIIAPTEAENRFVYFDPATSELRRWRVRRDKIYDDKDNFQPRVGVIWDPFGDGKTSIRPPTRS